MHKYRIGFSIVGWIVTVGCVGIGAQTENHRMLFTGTAVSLGILAVLFIISLDLPNLAANRKNFWIKIRDRKIYLYNRGFIALLLTTANFFLLWLITSSQISGITDIHFLFYRLMIFFGIATVTYFLTRFFQINSPI